MINEYVCKKNMSFSGCYKFKEVNQETGWDEHFPRKKISINSENFPSTSTHKQYDQNPSLQHVSKSSTYKTSEYSKIKIKEYEYEAPSIYRKNCKVGLTGKINDSPFHSIGIVKLTEKSKNIKIKEVKTSSFFSPKNHNKHYDKYLLKNKVSIGHKSNGSVLKNNQSNAPNVIRNTSLSIVSSKKFSSKNIKELDYLNYNKNEKEHLRFKSNQTSHKPSSMCHIQEKKVCNLPSGHAKSQISCTGLGTHHKSPMSAFVKRPISASNSENVAEKRIKFREKNEPLKVIKSFRNEALSSSDRGFYPPYFRKEKFLKKAVNIQSNTLADKLLAPTIMSSNCSQTIPKNGLNESGMTCINLKKSYSVLHSSDSACMPVNDVESSNIFPIKDLELDSSNCSYVYPRVSTPSGCVSSHQPVKKIILKETNHSTFRKKNYKLCLMKVVPISSCQTTSKHKRGLFSKKFPYSQFPTKHSMKNKVLENCDSPVVSTKSFTHFKESNDDCKIVNDLCPINKPKISPNVPERKLIHHVPNKFLDIQQQPTILEDIPEDIASNTLMEKCNVPVIQSKGLSKMKENVSSDAHNHFLQKLQKHWLKKASMKKRKEITVQETEKYDVTKSTDGHAKSLATPHDKRYILPKDKVPFIQFREKAGLTVAPDSIFIPTTSGMNKEKQELLYELSSENTGEICVKKDFPVPTFTDVSGVCESTSSDPSFKQNILSSSEIDLHQSFSDTCGELDSIKETKPSIGNSSNISSMGEKSKAVEDLTINYLEQSSQLSVGKGQSLLDDRAIISKEMSTDGVIPPSISTNDFTKSKLLDSETLQTYPPLDKNSIKKMTNVCVKLNRNVTLEKFMAEKTSNVNRDTFFISTAKIKKEVGNFGVFQPNEETAFSIKFEEESTIDIKLEPLSFDLIHPVKADVEEHSKDKSRTKSIDESNTNPQEIPEEGRVIIKEEHIEEEDKDQPLPKADHHVEKMFEGFDNWLELSVNDEEKSQSEKTNCRRSSLRVLNSKNKTKPESQSQEPVSNTSASSQTKKLKKKKKRTQKSKTKRLKSKSDLCKVNSKINAAQYSKIIENLIEVLPYKNALLTNQKVDASMLQKCPFCGVSSTKKAFDQHVFTHKVKLFYYCPICNFKSKRRYVMFRHISDHERESSRNTSSIEDCSVKKASRRAAPALQEIYKCKLCSYENVLYDTVQRHIQNHLAENKAVTRIKKNSKQLRERPSSKKRISSSQPSCKQANLPKKFCCDICQLKLNSIVDLKLHKMVHSKQENLKGVQCPICGFKCLKYVTLKSHILQHSELDFESSLESSPRLSRSDRKSSRHKSNKDLSMSHSKRIICPLCSKPFLQISTFQAHFSVHKTIENQNTVKKNANTSRIALRSRRSIQVQEDESKTLIKSNICKEDSNKKNESVPKLHHEEMHLKESMECAGEQNMCFTKFKKKEDTANSSHGVKSNSVCDSLVPEKHGIKPFDEDFKKTYSIQSVFNKSVKSTKENPIGNPVCQEDAKISLFDLSKVKLEVEQKSRNKEDGISCQPNKLVSSTSSSKYEGSFGNPISEHIGTVTNESVIPNKSTNLNEPRNIESLLPRFHENDYNHSLSSTSSEASTSMHKTTELRSNLKNEFKGLGHDVSLFSINNDQSVPLNFQDSCMNVIKRENFATQNIGKEITFSVSGNDLRDTHCKGNSVTVTPLKINKNVKTGIGSTSPHWNSKGQETSELNLLHFGTPVLKNSQELSSVSSTPFLFEQNYLEPLDLSTLKTKSIVPPNKDLSVKIKSEHSSEVISSLHFPVGNVNSNKNFASDHNQCTSGNSAIIPAPPAHSSGHFEPPQWMANRALGKPVSEPAMNIVSSTTFSKESNPLLLQSSVDSLKETTKFQQLIPAGHNESISNSSHQSITAFNRPTELSSFINPSPSYKGVFQDSFAALSRQYFNVSTPSCTGTKSIPFPVPKLFGDNKKEPSRSISFSTCVETRNEVKDGTSISSSEKISESKDFQQSLVMKSASKHDCNERGPTKEKAGCSIQKNMDNPLWEGVSSKLRVKVKIVDGEMTAEIINKSQNMEDANKSDLKSIDEKDVSLHQSSSNSSQMHDSHSLSEKCHLFKCSFCEFHTDKLFKLNTHLEGHSERNPFECSFCPETFPDAALLKTHIKKH